MAVYSRIPARVVKLVDRCTAYDMPSSCDSVLRLIGFPAFRVSKEGLVAIETCTRNSRLQPLETIVSV